MRFGCRCNGAAGAPGALFCIRVARCSSRGGFDFLMRGFVGHFLFFPASLVDEDYNV